MQKVKKIVKCPVCGCIYLPDAYHCPKCGASHENAKRNNARYFFMDALISGGHVSGELECSSYYTVYLDMADRGNRVIILKN
jgi:hypothetical protein